MDGQKLETMGKDGIDGVFQQGGFVRGSFINIKIQKTQSGHIRAAFIIKKNFFKNATNRNKTRRRLKEALRAYLKRDKDGASADVVFMPQEGMADRNYKEIKNEIAALMDKALLKSQSKI